MISLHNLTRDIDQKRELLIKTGLTKGLTSPETLKISQDLDSLLNKYQLYNKEK
ncbi:Spo0E family sporulation regulatory protein-aspartic acid phosphatase [Cytobacillus sp. FJAT-54145]|uniref:Spo0E family sporulation regulatory protein-aspartic acid phosphatase n=1 Tax=Cytobacillus spartinae TaxID=3299023 RepID=A0ABW6K7Q1_9BACI